MLPKNFVCMHFCIQQMVGYIGTTFAESYCRKYCVIERMHKIQFYYKLYRFELQFERRKRKQPLKSNTFLNIVDVWDLYIFVLICPYKLDKGCVRGLFITDHLPALPTKVNYHCQTLIPPTIR